MKQYSKRNKPDQKKTHIIDSIYMECPKIGKSIETESRLVVTKG